jgi:hypothetical protein
MTIRAALRRGVSSVLENKRLVVLLWLVNLAVALPAGWMMKDAIGSSIGASLVHEKMRRGFDVAWWNEFEASAKGLETTFGPEVSGAGPFYGNAEGWVTGQIFANLPGLVALGVLHALVWTFFLGGVLDAYSRPRPDRTAGDLLAAGAKYYVRFLQLALLSAALYFLIYRLAGWLFVTIHRAGRDVTVERTLLAYALAAAAFVALLLATVNMVFDHAKIAVVVDERASALAALRDALRFVRRRPGKAFGVYFALAAVAVALLAAYAIVAPGGRQTSVVGVALAFVAGQAFLVVKLGLRLTFHGSQVALYSDRERP